MPNEIDPANGRPPKFTERVFELYELEKEREAHSCRRVRGTHAWKGYSVTPSPRTNRSSEPPLCFSAQCGTAIRTCSSRTTLLDSGGC